jgi:hypothetical protein
VDGAIVGVSRTDTLALAPMCRGYCWSVVPHIGPCFVPAECCWLIALMGALLEMLGSSYSAPMPVGFWLWIAPNVAQSHVHFFPFYTFEQFLNLNQFQKWIIFRNSNFLIQMFSKSIPFKFEQKWIWTNFKFKHVFRYKQILNLNNFWNQNKIRI